MATSSTVAISRKQDKLKEERDFSFQGISISLWGDTRRWWTQSHLILQHLLFNNIIGTVHDKMLPSHTLFLQEWLSRTKEGDTPCPRYWGRRWSSWTWGRPGIHSGQSALSSYASPIYTVVQRRFEVSGLSSTPHKSPSLNQIVRMITPSGICTRPFNIIYS